MGYVLIFGLIFLLVFLPQLWVRKVFAQYQADRADIPGTGGQFAEHLIDQFQLKNAVVTTSTLASHFDPENRSIVLSPQYYNGKSLTAITVAAHEIGHLIQLEQGNIWLKMRSRLVHWGQRMEKIGALFMILMPFGVVLTRSPVIMVFFIGTGFLGLLINVFAHVITLPMELDASFNKALPLLIKGGYIESEDEPHARRILTAAALTYLASALSGLLSLARWLRVLRR